MLAIFVDLQLGRIYFQIAETADVDYTSVEGFAQAEGLGCTVAWSPGVKRPAHYAELLREVARGVTAPELLRRRAARERDSALVADLRARGVSIFGLPSN